MSVQMFEVEQRFEVAAEKHVVEATKKQLENMKIPTGGEIAIGVGSRGIHSLEAIVKATVDMVKEKGGKPFIVPAMASHGGATAEGQLEVLASYGITEATMGAPIRATMETVVLKQKSNGLPVHFDKNAAAADGIIPINRVKLHTDFHSTYESGVVKMLAIGFGKQKGAEVIHTSGIYGLKNLIPSFAEIMLAELPVVGGVAILENAYDQVAKIEFMPKQDLMAREAELIKEAKELMPSLPVEKLDLLIVGETGKNISGVGMDPNITGRMMIRGEEEPDGPDVQNIVVLDLTDESHGNALGVGLADVIPKRLYNKIDLKKTYANVITSGFLQRGFIPIVADNDKEAIEIAMKTSNRRTDDGTIKIAYIKNTLELKTIFVSSALLDEVKNCEIAELTGVSAPLEFTSEGEFTLNIGGEK